MRFLVIILFIFLSCSDSSKHKEQLDHSKSTSIKSENVDSTNYNVDSLRDVMFPEYIRVTDRNSLEYLTQFNKTNTANKVRIMTPYGNMDFILYKDTPLHRSSFIHLILQDYFSNIEITRIRKDHVVQGGNSQEESKAMQRFLMGNYTIPSEFRNHHIHKKGALALARQMNDNPNKESEPYDFYIVHGRKSGGAELFNIQKEKGISYTTEQKDLYKKTGGTPHLDNDFTVFGEIISGYSVLNKIANLEVDSKDWPKDDLIISIEIID